MRPQKGAQHASIELLSSKYTSHPGVNPEANCTFPTSIPVRLYPESGYTRTGVDLRNHQFAFGFPPGGSRNFLMSDTSASSPSTVVVRDDAPHVGVLRFLWARFLGCYVTKFALHAALNLTASCKLTFLESVVLHRVASATVSLGSLTWRARVLSRSIVDGFVRRSRNFNSKILSQTKCVRNRFAKENSHTNPSTYASY